HIGQRGLYHLEIGDTLVELATLSSVGNTGIEARLSHANRACGHTNAPAIKGGHSDFEPLPWLTKQSAFRNATIPQCDMRVFRGAVSQFFARHRQAMKAGTIGFNQKSTDAFML